MKNIKVGGRQKGEGQKLLGNTVDNMIDLIYVLA